MSRLIDINALEINTRGLFSNPQSAETDFGYSDGSDAERYLKAVFERASDLSSTSEELQLKIHDWPSEYHLSSKRANILRPLPIPAGSKVLELGCGCGAITRYLGETGCKVDAVEGSAIRADLARMRSRDLDNVNIIHANFNRLTLPKAEYDYVLLIGVAEYARRFSPGSDSDRGAVLDLLNRIRSALKSTGSVLIAIENRAGMKYLHGAHEDHYSLRFVGIDNYREPAGIRTYTRREWRDIALDAGFGTHACLLPFPDYKIPTVYLGEAYTQEDPNAWCHLEGIDSTDYTFLFDPFIPETLTWQGYNAAGVLADMANSFMLVLSVEGDLKAFEAIDFVHMPDFRRRREYCTLISKMRGEPMVRRQPLLPDVKGASQQKLEDEPYFDGPLLSSLWARSLLIYPDTSRFHDHLIAYMNFLKARAEQDSLPFDLLPNNIVVNAEGDYCVFDQEWRGDSQNDVDYLIFRAALTFANHYRPAIRQFARRLNLHTVGDFIRYCLQVTVLTNPELERYCDREDQFQKEVLVDRDSQTAALLNIPLDNSPVCAHLYPRLYWSSEEDFKDEHHVTHVLTPGPDLVTLSFELPSEMDRIHALRLNPSYKNRPYDAGFFNIESIHIVSSDSKGDHIVWSLDGEDIVINKAVLSQISLVQLGPERILAIAGDDPSMTFHPGITLTGGPQRLKVEIHIRYSASREYRLVQQDFLVKEATMKRHSAALEQRLEQALRAESDLKRIQSSPTWRLLTALRRRLPGRD